MFLLVVCSLAYKMYLVFPYLRQKRLKPNFLTLASCFHQFGRQKRSFFKVWNNHSQLLCLLKGLKRKQPLCRKSLCHTLAIKEKKEGVQLACCVRSVLSPKPRRGGVRALRVRRHGVALGYMSAYPHTVVYNLC